MVEEAEHIGLVVRNEDAVLCAAGGQEVCGVCGVEGGGSGKRYGFRGWQFRLVCGGGSGEQFGAAVEVFEPFLLGRLAGRGCGVGSLGGGGAIDPWELYGEGGALPLDTVD